MSHTFKQRRTIRLQLSHETKMFCRATQDLCRKGVTLCCHFYAFRSCNARIFSLTTCAALQHTT